MPKILVVDDNRDLAYKQSCLLGAFGHESQYATSAQDGLDMAEQNPPDVALIDLYLPDMDGREMASRLKERFPDVRVIAWSGWPMSAREAVKAGFDRQFAKPLDIDVLLETIDEFQRPCHA